jgi:hypothetical protein
MGDNIASFLPELENTIKGTFRESNTSKNIWKREYATLMQVECCNLNVATDLAEHHIQWASDR